MLVGGGHAHVQVLRRFAMDPPKDMRVLVVLDRPVAVYSGMVPGFVAGEYTADELEIDVVPLARRAGAGVLLEAAVDLDPVRREIHFATRPPLSYDVASLDVGSTVRGLALPGIREFALATRPIADFVRQFDARIEALLPLGRPPRIAVVGSGAAGVELTFTIDARLRDRNNPAEITLVGSTPHLLPGAPAATRRQLQAETQRRGIARCFGVRVTRVDAEGLATRPSGDAHDSAEETRLDADLVVWATGAAPVPFPLGQGLARLPIDEHGFLEVRDTLQAHGFENVFAVGDCARMTDARWVPRAGVYAVRQGPILEQNLRALIQGTRLTRYRPQRDFLSLLTLGDGRALGSKWGLAARGRAIFRLKDWIDRRFMDRFQILDAQGEPRPSNLTLGAMSDSTSQSEPGQDVQSDMACGGCAAKLGALPLAAALAALPNPAPDSSVILGLEARDDVAATRDENGRTTLHNIDVIRAFCDDPWLVGRIAASNALSDLHAKGGRPQHAQAIIGLPDLPPDAAQALLFQALSGLRKTLDEEGVSLLGGHTTIGEELTVGLAVTGHGLDEASLLRQSQTQVGDLLLLTQPLGTGVVLAADMQGLARGEWVTAAHRAMQHTNGVAGRSARELGANAATDVTGFGFAGHLLTLLEDADVAAEIDRSCVPLLPGAAMLWSAGLRSTAHPHNAAAFRAATQGASDFDEAWLFDPQTAGGLLIAVPPDRIEALEARLSAAGEPPTTAVGRIIEAPAQEASNLTKRIRLVDRNRISGAAEAR